jgi:hypothetical protein
MFAPSQILYLGNTIRKREKRRRGERRKGGKERMREGRRKEKERPSVSKRPALHCTQASRTCKIFISITSSESGSVASNLKQRSNKSNGSWLLNRDGRDMMKMREKEMEGGRGEGEGRERGRGLLAVGNCLSNQSHRPGSIGRIHPDEPSEKLIHG